MSRILTALAAAALLAGCDSANPFQIDVVPEDTTIEPVDPNDPNDPAVPGNRFAFDPERRLTMNSVNYDDNGTPADPTDDTVVINNLPFDGPDGVYDDVAGSFTTNADGQTTTIFQNRETTISGEMQYYAVLVRSDYLEATSAAGRNWGDFGFAGANVNRTTYAVPQTPESSYVYNGVYAATRTYDDRGGIELIRGDVTLLLDVQDLDPNFPGEGLQGTIVGSVTDRTRDTTADSLVGDLPDIELRSVSFNTVTGVWEDGSAATFNDDGTIRDTGEHSGMIAGPTGEEMGGYVIIEGAADVQTITYDVVNWELVTPSGTQVGQTTGLSLNDQDDLQALVNSGVLVGNLDVTMADLPTGAVITGTGSDELDIETEYDAREIGVFVTDIQP